MGTFGNAILSRLPVVKKHHAYLEDQDCRNMIAIRVRVDGEPGSSLPCSFIDVIGTHLDHVKEPRRIEQWRELDRLIREFQSDIRSVISPLFLQYSTS